MKKTVITLLAVSLLQLSMVSATFASDTLTSGQTLTKGNMLQSADGRFALDMQTDGNLVQYYAGSSLWSSSTNGDFYQPYQNGPYYFPDELLLTSTGLLEITDSGRNYVFWRADTSTWISNHYQPPMVYPTYGDTLVDQDDGNVVLYDTHSSSSWLPVWATDTGGH